MTIEGDSREYDLLASWSERLAKKNNNKIMLTAEVGVRKGLGTKLIMNYIRPNYSGLHFHVGIDPYGDLVYQHYDKSKPSKMDYDHKMFSEVKKDFAAEPRFNLINLTDVAFMEKYYYGVDFYWESKKYLLNEYSLVHFDGPHKTTDVLNEAIFFAERAAQGAVFIFDDWKTYNCNVIRDVLNEYGFDFCSNGSRKFIMERKANEKIFSQNSSKD